MKDPSLNQKTIVSILSSKWRSLREVDKREYLSLQKVDQVRYKRQKKIYFTKLREIIKETYGYSSEDFAEVDSDKFCSSDKISSIDNASLEEDPIKMLFGDLSHPLSEQPFISPGPTKTPTPEQPPSLIKLPLP